VKFAHSKAKIYRQLWHLAWVCHPGSQTYRTHQIYTLQTRSHPTCASKG